MPASLFPSGDNAITIDYGNSIEEGINKEVIARFRQLSEQPLPGMLEAVPAYSSLTIYYDPLALLEKSGDGSIYAYFRKLTEEWLLTTPDLNSSETPTIRIPVCYDGPDMERVSSMTGLNKEEIIELHSKTIYRVYMLGFLPGFPYMGTLDERLFTNRKSEPVPTEAGSVAIAGKQTGIYPLNSPGGWWVIGRTPLLVFNRDSEPAFLLQAGEQVEFYSISAKEFEQFQT